MVKPRGLSLLIMLALLIATASFVGHFATDAICVVLDAATGSQCTTGNVTSSRPDSASPITAELHGNFNLPPSPLAPSLIALAFSLIAITLTYLSYSPAPSPPPPKPLS